MHNSKRRSTLAGFLALLVSLLVPLGLYASSCANQASDVYDACVDQGNPEHLCEFNAFIFHCNCMGIDCTPVT